MLRLAVLAVILSAGALHAQGRDDDDDRDERSSPEIKTRSLPDATAGRFYSEALEARDGSPPYIWTLAEGSLPSGLALSAAGEIAGTPSAEGRWSFTVQVRSASGGRPDERRLSLRVRPAPLPGTHLPGFGPSLSVAGLPGIVGPAEQFPFGVSVSPAPFDTISGTLEIAFEPDAAVAGDDPMTRFSNGAREVRFTVPAGSASAALSPPVLLLTGTVSGTIRLRARFDDGRSDVLVASATIPRRAPGISSVAPGRRPGGLDIQIRGYSTERRMTEARFVFEVRGPDGAESVALSRDVAADFHAWYSSPASAAFGGAFLFTQSFAVEGDAGAIEAVTVILSNGRGGTQSARILIGDGDRIAAVRSPSPN